MIYVVVVCEGATEDAFIATVVQPELLSKEIYIQPRLISTSSYQKGGSLSRERVVRSLSRTLKEWRSAYVTTFFDLYGLPTDFPGQSTSHAVLNPLVRCEQIEQALHREVIEAAECRADRFVPHVQPYEFEALLFSDTSVFSQFNSSWEGSERQLTEAVENALGPEYINDGRDSHPSVRLQKILPGYRKAADGPALAQRIGIGRLRSHCQHFRQWFDRMQALKSLE